MVKYLKENFFVRYRRFDSFAQVNQLLEKGMADAADRRNSPVQAHHRNSASRRKSGASAAAAGHDLIPRYFDIRSCSGWLYRGWRKPLQRVPEFVWPAGINTDLPDDELRIYSNEQQMASHRLCSAASGLAAFRAGASRPLWQQVVRWNPKSDLFNKAAPNHY